MRVCVCAKERKGEGKKGGIKPVLFLWRCERRRGETEKKELLENSLPRYQTTRISVFISRSGRYLVRWGTRGSDG